MGRSILALDHTPILSRSPIWSGQALRLCIPDADVLRYYVSWVRATTRDTGHTFLHCCVRIVTLTAGLGLGVCTTRTS